MLSKLCHDHRGMTRKYYYHLDVEETLRRYRTKSLASEVAEERVPSWCRSRDLIDILNEGVFDVSASE